VRTDVAPVALTPDQAPGVLDEPALMTLYETTAERLHRYVAGRVGSDAAQDVVSEAFLVLWDKRAGQAYEADALRAWLYGVATNLLRHHVRAEERKQSCLRSIGPKPSTACSTRHSRVPAASRSSST